MVARQEPAKAVESLSFSILYAPVDEIGWNFIDPQSYHYFEQKVGGWGPFDLFYCSVICILLQEIIAD